MNRFHQRTMQQHRRIVQNAKKHAVPTKRKMEISCITGGIICATGVIVYPLAKQIAVGMVLVGGIQLITSTIVKGFIKPTSTK